MQCSANEGRERRRSRLSLRPGLGGKKANGNMVNRDRGFGGGGGKGGATWGKAADKTRSGAFIRNHPPRRRVSIIHRLCPPAASMSVKRHYVAAAF